MMNNIDVTLRIQTGHQLRRVPRLFHRRKLQAYILRWANSIVSKILMKFAFEWRQGAAKRQREWKAFFLECQNSLSSFTVVKQNQKLASCELTTWNFSQKTNKMAKISKKVAIIIINCNWSNISLSLYSIVKSYLEWNHNKSPQNIVIRCLT